MKTNAPPTERSVKRNHNKITRKTPKLLMAVTKELDISEDIHEKLTKQLNGPNSTIDGTEITCDAIAAIAAVPKFDANRELYRAIKSTPRETRCCCKLDYGCGTRCKNCFALHKSNCTIPSHYNENIRTPWNLRCFICHSRKTNEQYYLCGSVYCMFSFVTITKPSVIKYRYSTEPDKPSACANMMKIEWL